MKDGKFPKKWQTIDIFPEMKLYQMKNKTKIWLRKNRHPNKKQSNYLLEAKIDAESPKEALDFIAEKIESILDMLAFQLQAPISVTYVTAIDYSEPLKVGEEREWMWANSYPRVQKDSGFTYGAKWIMSIDTKLLQQKSQINTEAALRWFSKGISSRPVVDQFTSFWIALEILISPSKPRKKVFFQCRKCGYEIESCPKCSYSTSHFPETKERIESFVTKTLGMDRITFEKLWTARMIFHGRNKLTPEEIEVVRDATWKLRMFLVEALKKKLGLDRKDKPYLLTLNMIMMDSFLMGGHRKLTELDMEYAESR